MSKISKALLATTIAIPSLVMSGGALANNDSELYDLLSAIKSNPTNTGSSEINTLVYATRGGASDEFLAFLTDEIHAQDFQFPLTKNADNSYQFALLAIYNNLNKLRANQLAMPDVVLEPIDDHKGQYVPVPGLIKPDTPRINEPKLIDLDHTIRSSQIPSFIDYKLPGLYAVPGENIKIKVEVVSGHWNGKSLATIRVNQHKDNLTARDGLMRSPVVSASQALTPGEFTISSAYGGLISLQNHQYDNTGDFKTRITIEGGVIEAPVYKSEFTSTEQFTEQMDSGAPWGILEAEHVSAVVPAHELYSTADSLEQRQQIWSKVINRAIEHKGVDDSQPEFAALDPALQVIFVNDIQIKIGSWHSGYPIMAGPKQKLVGNPVEGNAWHINHELGHNFHSGYTGWKIEKGKSTEVSNNLYSTNHYAHAYAEGTAHYSRLVFDNVDRFYDAYNVIKAGSKYGDKAAAGVRLVLYRQLQLADPDFFKKLNQEVILQRMGIHPNEKTTRNRLTPPEFMVKYGSPILGYSLVGFMDYWGVAISDEVRNLISSQYDEPTIPVQHLFEDINYTRYVFNPDTYENQTHINDLATTFPADAGWTTYRHDMADNYDVSDLLTVTVDGEPMPVCRFNDVDQELFSVTSVFGVVEDGYCQIGEHNSLHGQQNASSINFQVVDLTKNEINGDVLVTLPSLAQTGQLCFRHQSPWTGVGYSLNGRRCSGNMTASNGNSWSFSSRNQMLSVKPFIPYIFPEDEAWTEHSNAATPLAVNIEGKERTVCRSHYKGYEIFGFVDNGHCAIGINNSVEGIVNYKNPDYQVVDSSLIPPNRQITTSLQNGSVVDLCYRKDGRFIGVGYSYDKRRCQSDAAAMKASNGSDWTFSSGSKFIVN